MQQTEEKVKLIGDILQITMDRQKSYVDLRRRDIRYSVGDKVFLKVSPWKMIMRFGRKGKLSPRFIRPYEVLERVGSLAYKLALPLSHGFCDRRMILTEVEKVRSRHFNFEGN